MGVNKVNVCRRVSATTEQYLVSEQHPAPRLVDRSKPQRELVSLEGDYYLKIRIFQLHPCANAIVVFNMHIERCVVPVKKKNGKVIKLDASLVSEVRTGRSYLMPYR